MEFGSRVSALTHEFSHLAEFTKHELEEFKEILVEKINKKSTDLTTAYLDVFAEYQTKIIEMIESKDFDWTDLYRKLSNLSEEELERER